MSMTALPKVIVAPTSYLLRRRLVPGASPHVVARSSSLTVRFWVS